MNLPTYRIANWNDLYENNRTRELKTLTWVPFPNSHDGDGYTVLMSQKNAESLLGAFVVIVQVASKCDPRGTLLRGGAMPHTAASLARITRFSEKTIEQCLQVCSGPEIGWILCENSNEIQVSAGGCDNPAVNGGDIAAGCLEGKGREGKGKKEENVPLFYSEARIILHWLNEKAGSHFREVDSNLSMIAGRLKSTDGDVEGVKLMVSRQCSLWKGHATMDAYLQPSTLFGVDNFEKYYGARNKGMNGSPVKSSTRDDSAFIDRNLPNSPV